MTIAGSPVRAKSLKRLAFAILTSGLARRLIGLWYGDTVPFRGTRIRTASRGSFEAPLLLAGIYERAEIDFVHRHLPPTQRVVELGSSLGGNSCQISRRLAPGVPMLCVEANPEIVGILRENISRNCGDRPVDVLHGMIGEASGEGLLEIGGSTLASGAGRGGVRTARVPMYTLGDVVGRLGGEPYSLVADIEGAELSFMTVNRAALKHCTLMIIECHATEFQGKRYTLDEVLALPLAHGEWEMIDRYHAVAVYRRTAPAA
jgi:FkbM family methyltransferase